MLLTLFNRLFAEMDELIGCISKDKKKLEP